MIVPRDYQHEAVQSVFDYFVEHKGNPLVAMPGGTGKSVVIGMLIQMALYYYPTTRIMMLTHVQELISQNLEKLLTLWPTAPAGVYSAGLRRKEHEYQITLAGIASVAKRAALFGHIDLVLIDEAHLVSPNDATMYQRFIAELRKKNKYLKVIGFSATCYRLGLGSLVEGGLFTHVCHDSTTLSRFNRYIDEGYLAPLVPKRTQYELSAEGVPIVGGEYQLSKLQAMVDKQAITKAALEELVCYGQSRHKWMLFGAGVQHCLHISEMLDHMGISNVCIHSKLTRDEREQGIAAFKAGLVRAAVNNNMLTTGHDFPELDLIGVLRHTLSTSLWVQMLSRGTRPAPWAGKKDCMVLDFARNTARLGPINDPVLPQRKGRKRGGAAPVRVCPICDTYNHTSARFCTECGYEFPLTVRIDATAGTHELIKRDEQQRQIEEVFVEDVTYHEMKAKPGRPPSLRVTYHCPGFKRFKEFVCFEHKGIAREHAETWWRDRSRSSAVPTTVQQALGAARSLRIPRAIRVWMNTKFPQVMGYVYAG